MGKAPAYLGRKHPTIREHTVAILTLRRAGDMHAADKVVAIGRHLGAVRQGLTHGEWKGWLQDEVPFTDRSAANYMKLTAFAEVHPKDYQRFRALGPSRLYAVAMLSRTGLLALRRQSDERLLAMSAPQFHAFARELDGRGDEGRSVEGLIRSGRRRVRKLHRLVEDVLAGAQEGDREAAWQLEADLARALDALRAGLGPRS